MARNFKICFDDGSGNREMFLINPADYGSLMQEIYTRKPETRNRPLKVYYEDSDGDKITITKPTDFELFLEADINKIFAETNDETVWKTLNQSLLNTVPTATIAATVHPTIAPLVSNYETQSVYTDEIRRIHHQGILCDVCDRDVYGFRYKCLDCDEFDMCMDCEPKQIHKEHLLLRITNPIDGEKNFELRVIQTEAGDD